MRHATDIALDAVEPLLRQLRAVDGIQERKRGVFYRRSSAFLHFHEDPAGFFADVRLDGTWSRVDVTRSADRTKLVRLVRDELAKSGSPLPPRAGSRM